MLNRMVYLATQSANGTYDNTTDRANLQKEVDQLREEINRIADSANFNGIKLLDGTMDAGGAAMAKSFGVTGEEGLTGDFMLPKVGDILGTDTVLHKDAGKVADKTSFSVDLHNVQWDNATADFELKVGDATFKMTKGTTTPNGSAAAKAVYETAAITEAVKAEKTFTVTVGGKPYDVTGTDADTQAAAFVEKYNADVANTDFTVAYDANTDKFTFTQKVGGTGTAPDGTTTDGNTGAAGSVASVTIGLTAAAQENDVITVGGEEYKRNADGSVWAYQGDGTASYTVTGAGNSLTVSTVAKGTALNTDVEVSFTGSTTIASGVTAGNATFTGGANEVKETFTSNAAFTASVTAGADVPASLTYDGVTKNFTTEATVKDQLNAFITAYNGTGGKDYVASLGENEDTIVFTAKVAGAVKNTNAGDGTEAPKAAVTGATQKTAGADVAAGDAAGTAMDAEDIVNTIVSGDSDVAITGATLNADGTIKIGDTTYKMTADKTRLTFTQVEGDAGTTDKASKKVTVNVGTADAATGVSGDYNVSTTVISQKGEASNGRLASTVFTLTEDHVADGASITIGKDTYTFTTDANKIGKAGYIDATGTLEQTIQNLTDATGENSTYTVGNEGGGKISVTENEGQKDFDLTTAKGIAESLGFSVMSEETGNGLTLQIGDTSDAYNQITVSISDMHVDSLGIGDIDISSQAGAQAAVDKIKSAINSVSMTRGTLGATQNRLEHTANNLSVMEENITNAESAIRDTDIAEEMMAYTKNNILIQSAQAMLAQANMVPQGVLQLLQ